jgi:fatty acid desaturase
MPHHLGLQQFRGDLRFNVVDQNRFTRSCIYPKWFAHAVLLNFNLHTAHHLFPSHPWYQLDDLHTEIVKAGLQLNLEHANQWTAQQRRKPLCEVLAQSFDEDEYKRSAV